jgi:hypothetical protein
MIATTLAVIFEKSIYALEILLFIGTMFSRISTMRIKSAFYLSGQSVILLAAKLQAAIGVYAKSPPDWTGMIEGVMASSRASLLGV